MKITGQLATTAGLAGPNPLSLTTGIPAKLLPGSVNALSVEKLNPAESHDPHIPSRRQPRRF